MSQKNSIPFFTDLLLEVRGEEGEGNFAGAVGERQGVAGEDLQLVHQVVWQARILKGELMIVIFGTISSPFSCYRARSYFAH